VETRLDTGFMAGRLHGDTALAPHRQLHDVDAAVVMPVVLLQVGHRLVFLVHGRAGRGRTRGRGGPRGDAKKALMASHFVACGT
jgi:hypothetical protein